MPDEHSASLTLARVPARIGPAELLLRSRSESPERDVDVEHGVAARSLPPLHSSPSTLTQARRWTPTLPSDRSSSALSAPSASMPTSSAG